MNHSSETERLRVSLNGKCKVCYKVNDTVLVKRAGGTGAGGFVVPDSSV